jgi:hypothetical protein
LAANLLYKQRLMTAAGVQNIDSTAYVPPSPSTSMADTKGTAAAGKQAADPQASDPSGKPSDFRNELEQQQSGMNGTQPAGSPNIAQPKSGQQKAGQEKPGSSKTGKKRDAEPDGANVSAATPVPVADPQKPILPFTLALPQAQENAQPDAKVSMTAAPDDDGRPAENPSEAVLQGVPVTPISLAAEMPAADIKQTSAPKQSAKFLHTVSRASSANVTASATPDSSKAQPASGLSLPAPLRPQAAAEPAPDQAGSHEQDPSAQQNNSGDASRNQPVSPIEHNLPAAPPEPIATAVQEGVDSASSSPSALAFAARMAPAAVKTNPAVASNAAQILPVPGPQTAAQIPVRYSPMAQIIQSAVAGNKGSESKKDPGVAFEQLRADARSDIRTDTVTPQTGTADQPAQSSAPEAPQPPAPTAQLEHVIEPPAAPPASNHDIRVRVPDNNGGSTQVRFVESGGEVRVSVRTADEGLAQNLRTHLNDLTQRLSDGGMPAEIWRPASNGASSQNEQHQSNQDDRGSGGQGSGGQGGQQDRQQKRPAWLDEMEASLHPEPK